MKELRETWETPEPERWRLKALDKLLDKLEPGKHQHFLSCWRSQKGFASLFRKVERSRKLYNKTNPSPDLFEVVGSGGGVRSREGPGCHADTGPAQPGHWRSHTQTLAVVTSWSQAGHTQCRGNIINIWMWRGWINFSEILCWDDGERKMFIGSLFLLLTIFVWPFQQESVWTIGWLRWLDTSRLRFLTPPGTELRCWVLTPGLCSSLPVMCSVSLIGIPLPQAIKQTNREETFTTALASQKKCVRLLYKRAWYGWILLL